MKETFFFDGRIILLNPDSISVDSRVRRNSKDLAEYWAEPKFGFLSTKVNLMLKVLFHLNETKLCSEKIGSKSG